MKDSCSKKGPTSRLGILLLSGLIGCLLFAGSAASGDYSQDVDRLLDETFRIDISNFSVVFDYYPQLSVVDAHAVVTFSMRPGQVIPLIHFDPVLRGHALNEIRLDGELLSYGNEADVRIISFPETTQQALVFQRRLTAGTVHVLEMKYRLNLPQGYPRFSTQVHDLYGRGNEEIFPTINSPEELAPHTLTFRVHGDRLFHCIGSGLVESRHTAGLQEWVLRTERPVASYTVMFALLPQDDTILAERNIAGVDVRILAFRGAASIPDAYALLEWWLPELAMNFGPFPMPGGLSVLLVSKGGGMEYYGGTITSLWALQHEVFHMYFGCSTVQKTFRDSWLDEAINEWYEHSVDPWFYAMYPSYRSNWVGARSPIAVGFDRRAYDQGAHIMQAVAHELGGRGQMIAFLRYLHHNYSFAPFDTFEFLNYLRDYSGVNMESRFVRWLFDSTSPSLMMELSRMEEPAPYLTPPDLNPPESIRRRYLRKQGGLR